MIDVVIQLLRTCSKCEYLTALVESLVLAGDLAGHSHIYKAINVHLGVNREVLKIGLSDHGADGVGHAADTKLQAGTVGDHGNYQICNSGVNSGGCAAAGQLSYGRIVAFNNEVYVLDVDLAAGQTIDPREVLVNFENDDLCLVQHISDVRAGNTEAEVAVLIHRGNLEHSYIYGKAVAVEAGKLGISHGAEEAHALGDDLAVNTGAVPGVPGEVLACVLCLCDLGHPHGNAAADLNIIKLVLASSQSLIQLDGVVDAPAVINPVAGLNNAYSLFSAGKLGIIHFLIGHDLCSSR